ncbi:MAG: hypothetical protein IAE87_05745 [Rhodobacteraceae bacterium]|jgi:hypothetical protein|nr:hypothetical protein [Paracoccaceae bacterium]
MIAMLRQCLRRRGALLATGAALIVAGYLSDLLVPAALWYRLDAVEVADFRQGEEMQVTAQREILRPFDGSYQVVIWPADGRLPVCRGSDALAYSRLAVGRITQPLDWWAANQRPPCLPEMPPGRYRMETCVSVHMTALLLRWLPDRRTCVWSNVFEVKP